MSIGKYDIDTGSFFVQSEALSAMLASISEGHTFGTMFLGARASESLFSIDHNHFRGNSRFCLSIGSGFLLAIGSGFLLAIGSGFDEYEVVVANQAGVSVVVVAPEAV